MSTLLTPEDWARLQEIFDAATTLSSEERPAYLDSVCGESPGLRSCVESLLLSADADTRVGKVVGTAAVDVLDVALPAVGAMLGSYRITGIIGRGGMGVVYRAIRADDEYQKEVAIKAAAVGLLSPELRERFLSERQILATLDHPNIARLLDGGTTADGIPYVVMEFVSGKPIHTYCEEAGLNRRERIELIIEVAGAVDYAHRHLVIHRDLKPDNILVTAEGVPKLLDFGIAKALDPLAFGLNRTQTIDAMRLMTPDYASPEQIRGETITTSTDVYQIGILAYLLLTGKRVFQSNSGRISELEKAICEAPPPRPNLDKDLDQILLHALEKEPNRRYISVGALAEDLQRYLNGFPVKARPSSSIYRAGKFVLRHKLSVAMAGIAVVVILGFGIGMAILAKRLVRQRDIAKVQLHRAERVSEFMETVFSEANPSVSQGANLTAKDLLDRGAAHIDESLRNEPEVRMRLLDTFGTAYTEMGLYKQAEGLLQQSLDLRRKLFGARSPEVASCLVDAAEAGMRGGDYNGAVAMAKEAVALFTSLRGRDSEQTASAMDTLGIALFFRGDYSDSEAVSREAIQIWEKMKGPDSVRLFASLNILGAVKEAEGDYASAESLYRRELDIFRKAHKEGNSFNSDVLTKLGETLILEGNYSEAESSLQRALEMRLRIFGPKHNFTALTERWLGKLMVEKEQYRQAEDLLNRALALHTAALGPTSLYGAMDESNIGRLYEYRRKYAEAEDHYRRSFEALEKLQGASSRAALRARIDLARVLAEKGSINEASTLLQPELEKDIAQSQVDLAAYYVALSQLQMAQKQWGHAEESLRQALAISRTKVPLGRPVLAKTEESLGNLLLREGKRKEAKVFLEEAVLLEKSMLPADSPRLAETETLLRRAQS